MSDYGFLTDTLPYMIQNLGLYEKTQPTFAELSLTCSEINKIH